MLIDKQDMFTQKTKVNTLNRLTCKELNTLGFQMDVGKPCNNWYGLKRTDINLVAKVLKEKEQKQSASVL